MLVCGRSLSFGSRTLSIGKSVLTPRILVLSLDRISMGCILTSIAITHIQIYAEHNQTQYTKFNERTNTLLYKNISLTLYSRKGDVLCCVWDELETGTDCYIDPKFFFDHRSTSFSSGLELLNCGSLRATSPQSASWFSRWHPISYWLKPSVPWLSYCLTSTCFCCSSAYLHRCIS